MNENEIADTHNECTTLALAFASALVAGDFDRALTMLAPTIRESFTPESLQNRYRQMFCGYARTEPTTVHFDEGAIWYDWLAKQPGDIAQVYISIYCDEFCEGVAVTISSDRSLSLIREIEWGRP